MQHLDILRPDDWHLHLRDGELLRLTVNSTARVFRRAIVMPNLKQPVTTTAAALAYRERILAALDPQVAVADFRPLMTLYLTDATASAEIVRARASGCIHGVKLYPAGATTNSEAGVTDIRRVHPALAEMERCGMPLLVHGEVTAPEIDVFDREQVFIDTVLAPLLADFPGLKVVFEHITTRQAVDFVMAGPAPRLFSPPRWVDYRGALLGEEKERLLDEIDILVVPSRTDGRPLAQQRFSECCAL